MTVHVPEKGTLSKRGGKERRGKYLLVERKQSREKVLGLQKKKEKRGPGEGMKRGHTETPGSKEGSRDRKKTFRERSREKDFTN